MPAHKLTYRKLRDLLDQIDSPELLAKILVALVTTSLGIRLDRLERK